MKNFEDGYHKHNYSMYSKYKYIYITGSSDSSVFLVFALRKKLFVCKKKTTQTPKPDFH